MHGKATWCHGVMLIHHNPERGASCDVSVALYLQTKLALPAGKLAVQSFCIVFRHSESIPMHSARRRKSFTCFGVQLVLALLNHKEGVLVSVSSVKLHLKIAESVRDSAVQDTHLPACTKCQTGQCLLP